MVKSMERDIFKKFRGKTSDNSTVGKEVKF
jgi:hypothetical protein